MDADAIVTSRTRHDVELFGPVPLENRGQRQSRRWLRSLALRHLHCNTASLRRKGLHELANAINVTDKLIRGNLRIKAWRRLRDLAEEVGFEPTARSNSSLVVHQRPLRAQKAHLESAEVHSYTLSTAGSAVTFAVRIGAYQTNRQWVLIGLVLGFIGLVLLIIPFLSN
jgi:hypothetical protein